MKAGKAAYNPKRLGGKSAFANPLVIRSPSPAVILSKAKKLETLLFPFASFKVGLTNKTLSVAKLLGLKVAQLTISKIERGTRPVFDFEVVALAKALKVFPAWLLKEANNRDAFP